MNLQDLLTNELEDRFWSKVDIKSDDECWEWKAYKKKSGHGMFCIHHGKYITAQRMCWILVHEDIPIGLEIRHICDNPPCCNPRHLFKGTHLDNVIDYKKKEVEISKSRIRKHGIII